MSKVNKFGLWDKNIQPKNIGGEALIEGVMMRGPKEMAIAVRKADGEIVIEKKPLRTLASKHKFFKTPIIRGAVGMFESLVLGMKAIIRSAEFVDIEEEENDKPSKIDSFLEKVFGDKIQEIAIYISVIFALMLGIGLFFLLPNFIAGLIKFNKDSFSGLLIYNLVEGVVRIGLFLGYIALVSKMKDIQRVFEYHGAEHKTIHCYEHGEELTVENVRKYTTRHPRCGTAFLFVVMIISILVFSFIGVHNMLINVISRLLLIPLVAGISYEVIKFAGRSCHPVIRLVSMPGLMLQRFTTREPDDKQIEVAIAALENVIVADKDAEKW